MKPRYPVREVMKRTMFNLDFIEKRKTIRGPYETVQLINSFLGALVHVKERYQQHIPKTPLPAKGWPTISTAPPYAAPFDLQALVILLRNCIAHGNMEFVVGVGNEIVAVKLWNTKPKSGKKTWETTIDEKDLRSFLLKFSGLMNSILTKYEK